MADEFGTGLGATSVVFGITAFLFFGTAIISGRVYDRIGPYPLVFIGGLLFCGGLIGTSLATEVWHGYFGFGFGCGFGGGLFISPLYALAASWFQKYRAVAQGLVATGPGLGTLLLIPLTQELIGDFGWRTAMRYLAIIAGGTYLLGIFLIKRAPIMRMGDPKLHMHLVVRTSAFWQMFVSSVLFSTALIGSLGVVIPFAEAEGIDTRRAGLLLSAVGASSIFGRLLLTSFASKLGSVRLFKMAFFGLPIAYGVWLLSLDDYLSLTDDRRFVLMLIFAAILGVSYGGFVALMGDVVAHLFGLVGIGTVMGVLFFSAGLGSLIGAPMAGFLADYSDARLLPIVMMLVISMLGALILLPMTRQPLRLATWLGSNGPLPPLGNEAESESQVVAGGTAGVADGLHVHVMDGGEPIPARVDVDVMDVGVVPVPDFANWTSALRAAPPRVFWPTPANYTVVGDAVVGVGGPATGDVEGDPATGVVGGDVDGDEPPLAQAQADGNVPG